MAQSVSMLRLAKWRYETTAPMSCRLNIQYWICKTALAHKASITPAKQRKDTTPRKAVRRSIQAHAAELPLTGTAAKEGSPEAEEPAMILRQSFR